MKKYSILTTILLYQLEICVASCVLESEQMVGVEEGELFSNKDEILALDFDKWKLNRMKTCEDADGNIAGI